MQYQSRWYVSTQHRTNQYWPTLQRGVWIVLLTHGGARGKKQRAAPLQRSFVDSTNGRGSVFYFCQEPWSNLLIIWWMPFYIWRRDFSDFVNESWFWSQQMHFGCERGIKLRSTASSWHQRTKVCVFGNDDKRERARCSFWLIIFMMILYLVPSRCFHDPVIWDLSAK